MFKIAGTLPVKTRYARRWGSWTSMISRTFVSASPTHFPPEAQFASVTVLLKVLSAL